MKLIARSDVLRILYSAEEQFKQDFDEFRTEYERGEYEATRYLIAQIKEAIQVRMEIKEEE